MECRDGRRGRRQAFSDIPFNYWWAWRFGAQDGLGCIVTVKYS